MNGLLGFLQKLPGKAAEFGSWIKGGFDSLLGLGKEAVLKLISITGIARLFGGRMLLMRSVIGALGTTLWAVGGKLLGWILWLKTAWDTGQAIGTWIYNHLSFNAKDKIGELVTTTMAALGDKDAQGVLDSNVRLAAQPRPPLPPPPAPAKAAAHPNVTVPITVQAGTDVLARVTVKNLLAGAAGNTTASGLGPDSYGSHGSDMLMPALGQ